MSWTTPEELRAQVEKLWERGHLLAQLVEARRLFPLRLGMRVPMPSDYTVRPDAVRQWALTLQHEAKALGGAAAGYRLVLRDMQLARGELIAVPDQAWLDSLDDALEWLGRRREAQQFAAVLARTCAKAPVLLPWLERHAVRALALADAWPRLLDVVAWAQTRQHAQVYPRQVDLPGIRTDFIETHRNVLGELLDACLHPQGAQAGVSNGGVAGGWAAGSVSSSGFAPAGFGNSGFGSASGFGASGFGALASRNAPARPRATPAFRGEPVRVRLRMLDPRQALLPTGTDQDFTLTHDTFVKLQPAATRVFITDSERNLLAFPALDNSMVVCCAGHGPEMLAQVRWLEQRRLFFWGSIDTRGFAMLSQLRGQFPQVHSVLMDRETLMLHKMHWDDEAQPVQRELEHLDPDERTLYDDLRQRRIGERHVRLDQEQVGFGRVEKVLAELAGMSQPAVSQMEIPLMPRLAA